MEVYHNTGGDSEGGGDASAEVLKALISSAKEEPSLLKSPETAGTLAMEIGKKLCDLLLQPYDDSNLKLPLGDLGLDSLVALELRVWWKQVFAFDVTSLGNVGHGIASRARSACSRLNVGEVVNDDRCMSPMIIMQRNMARIK